MMDAEERMMLAILVISCAQAALITWKSWPSMKRRLEKSRTGRLFLQAGRSGRKPVFFVHTYIWLAVLAILLFCHALCEG